MTPGGRQPKRHSNKTKSQGDIGNLPDNLTERAYSQLLRLMLNGEIPRGVPLNERRLAELIGVSRSPLRAAIGKLVSKGLLLKTAHGALVEPMDFKRVAEIFTLRRILELDAAGLAAASPKADRVEAEASIEPASWVRLSGYEAWQNDHKFHNNINILSGNSFAAAMIGDLRLLAHVLAGDQLNRRQKGSPSEEHETILAAVRRQDANAARKAMEDHLKAERNAIFGSEIA